MSAATSASNAGSGTNGEPTALELVDVAAGYGRTAVLRGVSLAVPAGQVTALLGPNGAGKTTLLRTVSGLLPCNNGTVSMFGDDITKVSPYRRFERGLCHIPEGRGVFRSLTVRDNIVMQSKRREERDAVERATEVFPILGERLSQLAGTLSGGEQQMLAMAVAYVRDSRLILVDEASLGLAPRIVDQIFGYLHRLSTEGHALLLIDQFVTRALEMATTAYVIVRGEIAYSGGAPELLDGDVFSRYVGR
jgi:branched-chain amino acid transport system ATP-binding protein